MQLRLWRDRQGGVAFACCSSVMATFVALLQTLDSSCRTDGVCVQERYEEQVATEVAAHKRISISLLPMVLYAIFIASAGASQ
jgi:hypothetical protein